MKKLLIAAIILIFSAIPLFAEGQIGISFSPEFAWLTSSTETPPSMFETSFTFSIDGANYFPEAYGFGIEYGLGLSFPWMYWYDGDSESSHFSIVGIVFRLGAGYRYAFSDFLGLVAGLGLAGGYYIYPNASGSNFNLSMYGRVAADFTFIDALRVNAGLAIGGGLFMADFYAIDEDKYHLIDDTGKSYDISGVYLKRDYDTFFLAPFVSVSYVY